MKTKWFSSSSKTNIFNQAANGLSKVNDAVKQLSVSPKIKISPEAYEHLLLTYTYTQEIAEKIKPVQDEISKFKSSTQKSYPAFVALVNQNLPLLLENRLYTLEETEKDQYQFQSAVFDTITALVKAGKDSKIEYTQITSLFEKANNVLFSACGNASEIDKKMKKWLEDAKETFRGNHFKLITDDLKLPNEFSSFRGVKNDWYLNFVAALNKIQSWEELQLYPSKMIDILRLKHGLLEFIVFFQNDFFNENRITKEYLGTPLEERLNAIEERLSTLRAQKTLKTQSTKTIITSLPSTPVSKTEAPAAAKQPSYDPLLNPDVVQQEQESFLSRLPALSAKVSPTSNIPTSNVNNPSTNKRRYEGPSITTILENIINSTSSSASRAPATMLNVRASATVSAQDDHPLMDPIQNASNESDENLQQEQKPTNTKLNEIFEDIPLHDPEPEYTFSDYKILKGLQESICKHGWYENLWRHDINFDLKKPLSNDKKTEVISNVPKSAESVLKEMNVFFNNVYECKDGKRIKKVSDTEAGKLAKATINAIKQIASERHEKFNKPTDCVSTFFNKLVKGTQGDSRAFCRIVKEANFDSSTNWDNLFENVPKYSVPNCKK